MTDSQMNCRYCGSPNSEDEHRCRRCGRRLEGVSAIPFSREATARLLDPVEHAAQTSAAPAAEEAGGAQHGPAYQRSLFAHRDPRRVVELPGGAGARAKRPRTSAGTPAPAANANQQRLDFATVSTHPGRTEGPASFIVCDAMTARISSRVAAFAGDATLVGVSVAVFAGTVRAVIGELPSGKTAMIALGVAAFLIAALYKTLWCLGNGDSPGMQWARLRLLTFEGRRPGRVHRIRRAAAFVLSLAACGIGLAWGALEEDNLAWHDSISRTFPTED